MSQSQLLSSLTDLQNALLTANVNSTDNTDAIEQLQIIMGSIPGIAVPSSSSASGGSTAPSGPTPAQAAAAQALLDAQNARAAAAQKIIDDVCGAQKLIDAVAAAASVAGPPPSPSLTAGLSGIAGAADSGVASLFGYGTKPSPPPIVIPGVGGISTAIYIYLSIYRQGSRTRTQLEASYTSSLRDHIGALLLARTTKHPRYGRRRGRR
jgi:hypothetical protein